MCLCGKNLLPPKHHRYTIQLCQLRLLRKMLIQIQCLSSQLRKIFIAQSIRVNMKKIPYQCRQFR